VKTALYWESYKDKIKCLLCPHFCIITAGSSGLCKVRKNIDGELVSTIFGEATSIALDPVEKKPLYHFYPGSKILSAGTNGCNFSCQFCQNWEISQNSDSGRQDISAAELINTALKARALGIAYTYNEPFVWFEFVLETAQKAKKAGLKNVLVTNGYVNRAPLRELLPFIDAMNIDLKAFKESFYKNICNGGVEAVKNTIKESFKQCHIELTNLLIPSLNDTEKELQDMAEWIASISPDIPVHLSRYFPYHKMTTGATTEKSLLNARAILSKALRYVYLGNTNIEGSGLTRCHKCNKPIADRTGYSFRSLNLVKGKCGYCGNPIYGKY